MLFNTRGKYWIIFIRKQENKVINVRKYSSQQKSTIIEKYYFEGTISTILFIYAIYVLDVFCIVIKPK